mmetsp:Transcript_18261/g.29941  ORF Transcript_18261/g.29941 Transcript_18261/m.29941 type:complete len:250 (+) Transcript_18261:117-866(+)|eukprot:scaffold14674_cov141-Skeletonema_menzelii.AAC.5
MVRLSGTLDLGVDKERERRQQRTNNSHSIISLRDRGDVRFDARRENNGSVNRRINNLNLPIPNGRSNEVVISGRLQEANFIRGVQHLPNEHGSGVGRDRGFPIVKTTQVKNQERLRPKLLSTIPRIIKQESIEMENLLSDSISNTIRTDSTLGSQVVTNRRDLHTHPELRLSPPRQYNDVLIDDEEGDIVCCEDSFRHEGTKNICTIFIWAALVFFIMNRFFLHMSMYLHRGEETKEGGVVGDNVTLPG